MGYCIHTPFPRRLLITHTVLPDDLILTNRVENLLRDVASGQYREANP